MNKRIFVLIAFAVLTTVLNAQQFQLKWETPSTQGNQFYLGNLDGAGGGEFLIIDSTNFYIYDCVDYNYKWTFQKHSNEDFLYHVWPELLMYTLVSPMQDYNGNGVKDLFFYQFRENSEIGLKLIDPSSGTTIAEFSTVGAIFYLRGLADVDNDDKLELLIEKRILGPYLGSIQVYSTDLSLTSISNVSQPVPNQFYLEQNYPNPFNPSTRIQYQISAKANVQIHIFNLAGQLIRTLLNERKDPGDYSINCDGKTDYGTQVATGTYFYQIQAAGSIQTKKMILLR